MQYIPRLRYIILSATQLSSTTFPAFPLQMIIVMFAKTMGMSQYTKVYYFRYLVQQVVGLVLKQFFLVGFFFLHLFFSFLILYFLCAVRECKENIYIQIDIRLLLIFYKNQIEMYMLPTQNIVRRASIKQKFNAKQFEKTFLVFQAKSFL